jgi:hypothetical protein
MARQKEEEKEVRADGEIAEPVKEETRYVLREKKIPGDPYNVIRTRVRITPAVCEQCALDLVELNLEPGTRYEDLNTDLQAALRQALADHRRTHTTAEQLIVSESQVSRQWLGTAGR